MRPVKFVVLFVVPKNQFQTHLRTLASIAKFLNDRATRESLGTAGSAEEILANLRDRPAEVGARPHGNLPGASLRDSYLDALAAPPASPQTPREVTAATDRALR